MVDLIDTFISYIGKKDDDINNTTFYNTFLNLNYDNKKHNDKTKLFILMNATICFLVDSNTSDLITKKITSQRIENIKKQIRKIEINKDTEIPYLRYCYFYVIFYKYIRDNSIGINKPILSIKLGDIKDKFLKKCCVVYYILNNDIYI